MEIKRVESIGSVDVSQTKQVVSSSISFSEIIGQQHHRLVGEQFEKRIREIEEQGKKLVESRTIEDLRKYKKLVKQCIDETVKNGLQLSEQYGFGWNGRSRVYKIVKEIDKQLIRLTEDLLNEQKTTLDLLGTIDAIRGLIINIYV
ncbi:hypothetical protein NP92_07390 [Anoxybacillus gonensis]|uniref:YaaR family protein n=1 Tax=Anoxybacillus gonensis TaxID=198467 RepID=A0AAW7TJ81_9BACL|nr:YaaR family protein [Anoxybacillus gonensis]AKS39511.1 hypothetical protein AFK25_13265 [Anoxybacillus gonensis]KGP60604.1 hypothetical protein NP92_07390 [Anoxybacillus gonensis]MCX8047598.1 YaaR family protein [Anoxybacillus gonensis]MDO0877971.1 YaaR family protein [Anoxybacillus gonensis]